jgi:hypothetical protein
VAQSHIPARFSSFFYNRFSSDRVWDVFGWDFCFFGGSYSLLATQMNEIIRIYDIFLKDLSMTSHVSPKVLNPISRWLV